MTEAPIDKWLNFREVGPTDVEWNKGPLPPVESVPFDCVLVVWLHDYIGLMIPWGDNMNPLRWCDSSYFPRWGITMPEGWWAWVKKGSKPRPEYVKTWAESFSDVEEEEE